jgi:hypothetical protein
MSILRALLLTIILLASGLTACNPGDGTSNSTDNGTIRINPKEMVHIATVDERYQSYNVEMAEVIGGNFWKPYDEQSTPDAPASPGAADLEIGSRNDSMFQFRPPVDLYNSQLRRLASALGPAYLRVSGTWANSVYFQDSDEPALTSPPEGFRGVLTRQQWKGVVDFSHAVDATIMTSFAISQGVRNAEGIWTPSQAKAFLEFNESIGGDIAAAEFFNEPTIPEAGGAPPGYNAENFAKDFAVFRALARNAAPDMLIAGPGSVGDGIFTLPASVRMLTSVDLLSATPRPVFDVFSYHFYGAASQRCAFMGKDTTTTPEAALSEEWLSKTGSVAGFYKDLRDQFEPGDLIWLTETAETACGGNPWASTFLDSFRYLNQLGRLAKSGVSAVFHNTLAASDYGLIDQTTLTPRPNYWAALLWKKLMGKEVYEAGNGTPGVYLYAHSSKSHEPGIAVLVINTNEADASIEISADAEQYTLTSSELQGRTVDLNGQNLHLGDGDPMAAINGKAITAGTVGLPPASITFFTFADEAVGK